MPFGSLKLMDFGKPDTNHMGWLWIKPHHFSQMHYDLELVLLKIINNEKYLHRIHMIARKKKTHFFETVFKTTNHPQKPHGHKMKQFCSLICGAFKHSPSASGSISGTSRISMKIPDLELPRKQCKHTSTGLSFKRNNFPQGQPYTFETNLF